MSLSTRLMQARRRRHKCKFCVASLLLRKGYGVHCISCDSRWNARTLFRFSPAPWSAIACCKQCTALGAYPDPIGENELSSVVNAPQHPTSAASTFCPQMLAVVNKCGCCVSVRRTRPRSVGKSIRTSAAPPLSIGKLVKGYWGHMPPRSGGHCPLPLARLLRGAKSADSPARVARRA